MSQNVSLDVSRSRTVDLNTASNPSISLSMGRGGQGTSNYEALTNKPSIEGVVLIGDKSLTDFGEKPLSNIEIKTIFDRVFRKD